MLPEFDLLMPEALPNALNLLVEGAPDTTPLAGGTNLIPDMLVGGGRPRVLMSIAGLNELRGIRRDDGHLAVGGGVTISELLDDPLIARHAPLLRDAAAVFANPLVRNRATVGGNLVNASPAADTATPLLALGAEVELDSVEGSRYVPLEEFFVGVGKTVREPQELLVSVRCPVPSAGSVGAFRKLALRKAGAISVVSVAVMVSSNGDGHCERVRIALGAVAETPVRARMAEDLLCGQSLTPESIAQAARLSAEATSCIDDIRGSASYRERVVGVLVGRLLTGIAGRIG
jgi:CO/xanthine dehydrogenase FAD-binding subunit